jgi:3alpha(or 20beta)-hydroxysteroid dehydrogenase
MGQLDGKIAIVTGAARGTGAATAKKFVAEGARVVIGDVLEELGTKTAAALGDAAAFTPLDVTSEASWTAAVEFATRRFGTPTVLVNNAGVLVVKSVEDTTLDDFERVVRVNQIGAFLGIKALIAPMRAAGGGSIINVSSTDGFGGGNGRAAYCSSKWGLRGLTKAAALDLGRARIRVNAVCPGGGSAEMVTPWIPEGFDPQRSFDDSALKRACDVDEIAAAIVFLASDASSFCTGSDLVVDGGYTAGHVIHGFPGD